MGRDVRMWQASCTSWPGLTSSLQKRWVRMDDRTKEREEEEEEDEEEDEEDDEEEDEAEEEA